MGPADLDLRTGLADIRLYMQPYYDIFDEQDITYQKETEGQELPLCFTGTLKPGTYRDVYKRQPWDLARSSRIWFYR